MEQKIPKILHYVWMGGGKKSDLILSCIDSWKKFCPDFEIIEWNETNFDVENCPWVKKALANKNWALASDYIRLWAIYNHGGIYLDTDCEVIKSLDGFLKHNFFIGFESKYWLNPAAFGSIKGHEAIKKCMERYTKECDIRFSTNPLTVHTYGTVLQMLYNIKMNGKEQHLNNGVSVYPVDYFCPQNYISHRTKLTDNSHIIHRYASSWHSKAQKRGARFAKKSRIIMGKYIFGFFEWMVAKNYKRTIKKQYKNMAKGN